MDIRYGLSLAAVAMSIVAIFVASYSILDDSAITPQTRNIELFSQVDENIDEDKLGIPPDQFSLGSIVVNKGDMLRIHYANLEPVETQEHHTFTISDPYNI